MPIIFAAKIVRLKVYIIRSLSDDLGLHLRSQLRLTIDKCFNLYFNSNIFENISAMTFKLGKKVDLCMGYLYPWSFRWRWPWCKVTVVQHRTTISFELWRQLSKQHAATVGNVKFYFNLKFSVAFILNYGNTGISCKIHLRNLDI